MSSKNLKETVLKKLKEEVESKEVERKNRNNIDFFSSKEIVFLYYRKSRNNKHDMCIAA